MPTQNDQPRIIIFPKITDSRGNLTPIEGSRQIPFDIKRVFYLYDIPSGESRAGHALKTCEQIIIAISGSFDVILDSGMKRETFRLDRPFEGLYVPPFIWREIENFSAASSCLVLASEVYNEDGYIREYEQFLQLTHGNQPLNYPRSTF